MWFSGSHEDQSKSWTLLNKGAISCLSALLPASEACCPQIGTLASVSFNSDPWEGRGPGAPRVHSGDPETVPSGTEQWPASLLVDKEAHFSP